VLEFLNDLWGLWEPSRNRVVAPSRQATHPGGIGSLESIFWLLKSLKTCALSVFEFFWTVVAWTEQEVSRELPFSASATPEAVANLQYLKAFVKETFRVWPNGTEVSIYSKIKL
jgi:hypothetical protein